MGVRDIDRGFKALKGAMIRGDGLKAVAGIQGRDAEAPHGDFGVRNVDIAVFHEFGTMTIPERSFVRATFDRKRAGYKKAMDKVVARGLDGKAMERALGRLALRMAADMINTIDESIGLAPLAESTARARARKRGGAILRRRSEAGVSAVGAEKPLLDTAQLKRSITGIVRRG